MPLLKEDRYTLADALTWDKRERIELIDGAPVAEAEQLSLFGAEERPRLAEVKEVAAECLASAM